MRPVLRDAVLLWRCHRAEALGQDRSVAAGDWDGCIGLVATVGDRAAFAALFRHFAPRVKSYLLRCRVEPAMAEELSQETMLTVWRKAAMFDSRRASASTWIFTIARNLRVDALRGAPHPDALPDDLEIESNAPLPSDVMLGAERE